MSARSFVPFAVLAALVFALVSFLPPAAAQEKEKKYLGPLEMTVPPIASDKSVKYDFPIVYVRAPRRSPDGRSKWAEVGDPRSMEPGAPLVLLQPDGKEEELVEVTEKESIADPQVSFDGETVYYAKMYDALGHKGSDIYKIHVPTRKIVRLTNQEWTPNALPDGSKQGPPQWGVYNLGPCPLPGGRLVFVSDRNGFKGTNTGYAPNALALQLFTMDDDGRNVECIGHLNLGMALHPVILKDGRIMFSSLESQGLRSHHLWGVWSINPDGTHWGPLMSAFEIGNGTADSLHFQTQLGDESIIVESYYNLNNQGFGSLLKFPIQPAEGYAAFGPGYKPDEKNAKVRHSRHADGRPIYIQFPFSPYGLSSLTPFIQKGDWPSDPADHSQKDGPRLGKFTHPAAAPDNHCLATYSPGSVNSYTRYKPAFDAGIYLIKGGKPVDAPGEMLLVKNDPNYHEQWPRALVPYKRIYGVAEPARLAPLANDGQQNKALPEGTPFGLVGSSSLYKRESYPYGRVAEGSVTAGFGDPKDPTGWKGHDSSHGWNVQGADAGLYSNDDIHAIRIVALEPTGDRPGGRTYYNHAKERMRVLGEIPVRKFDAGKTISVAAGGKSKDGQPLDPDGNPDTSFLAKIPADVAWTFQTLDKRGMVLNSSQTWHQLRAGETRTDCGGCHAHSQKPTSFADTAAARPDYPVFDLTKQATLITTKAGDELKRKFDAAGETGVRLAKEPVVNVEYFRDVQPILVRSCVACHSKDAEKPAGNLVLDDDATMVKVQQPAGLGFDITVPGSYARLAADREGKWGHKSLSKHGWSHLAASRYITQMQSRRSLLVWKIYGQRLDGWQNDDFPYEATPGDPKSLVQTGEAIPDNEKNRERAHLAFVGSQMPPPDAVKAGKVKPLSDEDRLTIVRWIDLGCPIDLTYDPKKPDAAPRGWLLDDQRPTLAVTLPQAGKNAKLDRLLISMTDLGSGLDPASVTVTLDRPVNGIAAGTNLFDRFEGKSDGVWELKLKQPLDTAGEAKLVVSVADKRGNTTRLERVFATGK